MQEALYQTNYLGFYVKVYADHVDFKTSTGAQSLSIDQISSVQPAMMGLMQVTILSNNRSSYSIPTMKKKEVEQAIMQAKERFVVIAPPQAPPVAYQQPGYPATPPQPYQTVVIQQPSQPVQTASQVKTYKSSKDFQRDQKRLAKQGWAVQSTTSHQPRRSVGGLLFKPFAMLRPPKPQIIVTYQKQS